MHVTEVPARSCPCVKARTPGSVTLPPDGAFLPLPLPVPGLCWVLVHGLDPALLALCLAKSCSSSSMQLQSCCFCEAFLVALRQVRPMSSVALAFLGCGLRVLRQTSSSSSPHSRFSPVTSPVFCGVTPAHLCLYRVLPACTDCDFSYPLALQSASVFSRGFGIWPLPLLHTQLLSRPFLSLPYFYL